VEREGSAGAGGGVSGPEEMVGVERVGGEYRLTCAVTVPRGVEEVFAFFSHAGNLDRITPRFLRFEVLTPEVEMGEGALIDYRIRVRGVRMRWRSEITAWEPVGRFVDEQVRGPYATWRHEHTFREVEGGTLMRDVVDYRPPGGALAPLVNWLFVERDVKRIFAYRMERLEEILGEGNGE